MVAKCEIYLQDFAQLTESWSLMTVKNTINIHRMNLKFLYKVRVVVPKD